MKSTLFVKLLLYLRGLEPPMSKLYKFKDQSRFVHNFLKGRDLSFINDKSKKFSV